MPCPSQDSHSCQYPNVVSTMFHTRFGSWALSCIDPSLSFWYKLHFSLTTYVIFSVCDGASSPIKTCTATKWQTVIFFKSASMWNILSGKFYWICISNVSWISYFSIDRYFNTQQLMETSMNINVSPFSLSQVDYLVWLHLDHLAIWVSHHDVHWCQPQGPSQWDCSWFHDKFKTTMWIT